jgi:chemotaxis protein methyltransferase CheR
MAPPSISTQVFALLGGLVGDAAGLSFDAGHMPLFLDKVSLRAAEAGFDSLLDYYYYLRYDPAGPAELDLLIEALVVGETYLFRELAPIERVVTDWVVPAVRAGRRPRLWCAACSTGEEPHTIAMLLAEQGVLDRVELVASDISSAALARARSGCFSRRAVRGPIPDFARAWVDETAERVTVATHLTQAIGWRRINLMNDREVAALGPFDVVLCRNVLIYFADDVTLRVLRRLQGVLRPGGVLLVGISESLLRFGTSLVCEEHRGVFLYRNPP